MSRRFDIARSSDDSVGVLIACACICLDHLQPGYRWLELFNPVTRQACEGKLFVKIKKVLRAREEGGQGGVFLCALGGWYSFIDFMGGWFPGCCFFAILFWVITFWALHDRISYQVDLGRFERWDAGRLVSTVVMVDRGFAFRLGYTGVIFLQLLGED